MPFFKQFNDILEVKVHWKTFHPSKFQCCHQPTLWALDLIVLCERRRVGRRRKRRKGMRRRGEEEEEEGRGGRGGGGGGGRGEGEGKKRIT